VAAGPEGWVGCGAGVEVAAGAQAASTRLATVSRAKSFGKKVERFMRVSS
jgi:hypothetical protein